MVVTKIKIPTAFVLMALTGSGVILAGYSSTQAGQSAPAPPTPPAVTNANPPEQNAASKGAKKLAETSPLGMMHDFGKVQSGTPANHDFCFVNTSGGVLKINSVRASNCSCCMGIIARASKSLLQPGEEWKLEISVDARRFRGRKTCPVWMYLEMDSGKTIEVIFCITADSQDMLAPPKQQ